MESNAAKVSVFTRSFVLFCSEFGWKLLIGLLGQSVLSPSYRLWNLTKQSNEYNFSLLVHVVKVTFAIVTVIQGLQLER